MSAALRLMVLGTASGVGKSWIATGLCRLFARRGLRVRPFKALNMSNNAAPARSPRGWGEIGRAQAAQAEAARVEPHVDMNPLLIKPMGRHGAQVIVGGHPEEPGAGDRRAERWAAVTAAWARISAEADVVVLEGAGSPAEINLRDGDIANMRMARHADARVLLVGDIERGGVFASLYGTMALLEPADRARVSGLVVNRFRGDPALFRPGLAPLEALCEVPVLGVIPTRSDIRIDEEDCQDIASTHGAVDVAVLRLPTVSNFTDLGPLASAPGVGVRWVRRPEDLGNPDLLVIPGSKHTSGDLAWLRRTGLDHAVHAAVARSIPVLGLCGGYQILGRSVAEDGVVAEGLGLLPVETVMAPDKTVRPTRDTTRGSWLLPAGLVVEGYEIHHGLTPPGPEPLLEGDGAVVGLVAGTYVHGLLDREEVADALVAALRVRKGLPPVAPEARQGREAAYDALADHLEEHLDLSWLRLT